MSISVKWLVEKAEWWVFCTSWVTGWVGRLQNVSSSTLNHTQLDDENWNSVYNYSSHFLDVSFYVFVCFAPFALPLPLTACSPSAVATNLFLSCCRLCHLGSIGLVTTPVVFFLPLLPIIVIHIRDVHGPGRPRAGPGRAGHRNFH